MHDCFAHTVFSTFSHAELAWRRRLGFALTYALCGATIAARIRKIIIPNFNAAQELDRKEGRKHEDKPHAWRAAAKGKSC